MSFVAAGTFVGVASGNITCGAPAGIQNDDILVAVFLGDDEVVISGPSGWAAVTNGAINNGGAAFRAQSFWKRASSESGSYVFTHTGGSNTCGRVSAWRGATTSGDPSGGAVADGDTSTTAVTAGSLTPSVDGCELLFFVLSDDDTTTCGSYAGGSLTWTERFDNGEGATSFKAVACASATQTTAASLSPTATLAPVARLHNSIVIALKPAAGAAAFIARRNTPILQAVHRAGSY